MFRLESFDLICSKISVYLFGKHHRNRNEDGSLKSKGEKRGKKRLSLKNRKREQMDFQLAGRRVASTEKIEIRPWLKIYRIGSLIFPDQKKTVHLHSLQKIKPYSSPLLNINMLSQKEVERGRYQYSTDDLTRYLTFRKPQYTSFGTFLDQILTCAVTTTLAHQLLYFAIRPTQQPNKTSNYQLIRQLAATRRPTQHSFTVFSFKLLLDFINERKYSYWTGYQVGALSGFLSFIASRPFDQMDAARNEIFQNERKKISRFEASRIIIKHDGFKGFYRNQNALGPFCSSLYRSVYFGLWHKLQDISPEDNTWISIAYLPFLASLGASIVSAVPDKLRSYSLQVNEERRQSLQKIHGKKTQPNLKSTPQLLIEYVSSKQFALSKRDFSAIGISVLKNWVILSFFALGQRFLKGYSSPNQHKQ